MGVSRRLVEREHFGIAGTLPASFSKNTPFASPPHQSKVLGRVGYGLTPDFLDVLEEGFKEFFEKEVPGNPQKAEYLIPIFIGELLEQGIPYFPAG